MLRSHDIASLRRNYALESLSEKDVLPDPIDQFGIWFGEATNSQLAEPNAMTLATSTPEGRPSARTVLLKGFGDEGFIFFTNYESRKGQELARNPHAALLFTWLELERQIRIEGAVEKVTPEASKHYFQSRPKESQIGAWASPQSRAIENREMLETRVLELQHEYAGEEVLPLPPFWGGYLLRPSVIEFWQGRQNRLHDRICYVKNGKDWRIERLAP